MTKISVTEVKLILATKGKSVSRERIKDMLEGNPMISESTTSEDAAWLIASHLEDER